MEFCPAGVCLAVSGFGKEHVDEDEEATMLGNSRTWCQSFRMLPFSLQCRYVSDGRSDDNDSALSAYSYIDWLSFGNE